MGEALPSLPTAQLQMPRPTEPLELPSVPTHAPTAEAAAATLRANAGDGMLTATEPPLLAS